MKFKDKRYINAILDTKEKFCSGCYMFRNTTGGKLKVVESGKNHRWVCINCYNNIKGDKHG